MKGGWATAFAGLVLAIVSFHEARALPAEGDLVCGDLAMAGAPKGTNVLLIVNDATRRDRVGAYGGPAGTPAFDAFASKGLLFDQAFTQAPWTSPSISTLFTSLYPSQHRVQSNPKARSRLAPSLSEPLPRIDVLAPGLTTLAEVLKASGYRTAAFVGNPWLQSRFGFDQGFDVYDDSFASWEVKGDVVVKAALKWIEALDPNDRWFVYVHLMDAHRPYARLAPEAIAARAEALARDTRPLTPREVATISQLIRLTDGRPAVEAGIPPSIALLEMSYDRGVSEFDAAFSGLIEKIDGSPSRDRTAVIVTADHGEALFARGYDNHGEGLYDDELSIPFAARLPGVTATAPRVACPIGLIDVMPTLCTYLGVPCPKPVFGTSILEKASARPAARDRLIVSEAVMFKPKNRAIRDRSYKLLWQPQRGPDGRGDAMFDMTTDPGELRDLLDPAYRTEASSRIFERLSKAIAGAVPPFTPPEKVTVPLDPELERRLRSLGYIQ
ncbi:MAG: sulfatase [Acidobacteria bacterium]|nr:sulfatase [Acidobacteriota bacterium]